MEFILNLKEVEITEETVVEKSENKVIIENNEDYFTIFLEEDKPKYREDLIENCYVKIGNLFKKIKISKYNNKILNINELIEEWTKLKKEIVFNIEDDMLVSYILNVSKYYENYEALEFLLNNFSIIPFFRLINFQNLELNKGEKFLEIYNIIPVGKIDYKVKLEYLEELTGEKEITFKGEKAPNFDMADIKKFFRENYNITKDKVFNLETNINGNYILEGNFLKELNICLTIKGGKYFVREYIISMLKV